MRRLSRLNTQVQAWDAVHLQGAELHELLKMAMEEGERELLPDLLEEVEALSAATDCPAIRTTVGEPCTRIFLKTCSDAPKIFSNMLYYSRKFQN